MTVIDINWSPGRGMLRLFGCLLLALATAGALALRRAQFDAAAGLLLVAGAAVALTGLLWPDRLRPVYRAWMVLTLPMIWLLSHIIMATLFFAVVTPVALVMRCLGLDPLQRRLDRTAETYWITRTETSDHRRYFRQY